MRTFALVLVALLGLLKGVGFAFAPDAMATLTPTAAPAARVTLAAVSGGAAALLLFAAPAARTPMWVRAFAAYAAAGAAFALFAPSGLWAGCMSFVRGMILSQPAVPALASVGVSLLLLWTAVPPQDARVDPVGVG